MIDGPCRDVLVEKMMAALTAVHDHAYYMSRGTDAGMRYQGKKIISIIRGAMRLYYKDLVQKVRI